MFEQRSDERVSEYMKLHGTRPQQWKLLQLRQQATLETRSHKSDKAESLAQKMSGWRERALNIGEEPATVIAQATGHQSTAITLDMLTDKVRDQIAQWVLADTSKR